MERWRSGCWRTSNKKPSSLWFNQRSYLEPRCLRMNRISIIGCRSGATCTRASATAGESMHGTRTVMAFMKCASTRWKAFGLCCAPGWSLIGVSPKNLCPTSLDSSSVSITQDSEVKGSWIHCSASFLLSNPGSCKILNYLKCLR
jgi:hypothetical protein